MAEDNQTDTTKPSPIAPALTGGSGGDVLRPGQKLPARKAISVAPSLGKLPTSEQQYFMPGQMYTGQYLVDANGVISRPQYSVSEAYAELAAMGDATKRANVLNKLYELGVYGRSRPTTTGFAQRDQRALGEAMLYANANGVTLDVALTKMAADPNVKANIKALGVGRTPTVRTTAKQDLRQVFKQAAGSVLGRQLSDAEVEKFVRSYNAMEVSEAMGGAAVPTAQTAAMQAVEASNPEEAGAMKMLGYADVIDQLMKGLG